MKDFGEVWRREHRNSCMKQKKELSTLRAEAARLREALETIQIRAAFMNHPGESFFDNGEGVMIPDWRGELQQMESALASTPTTAEWLAARDEEMKRLGAAEWLEKEAADFYERFGTHFYESTTDSMQAEAARLRAGK